MTIPLITLNDGHTIPQLGLGVFRVDPDDTERVVSEALEVGYRHIDTAQGYGNEEGVGRALAASGLGRDEVFVTTKLSNGNQVSGKGREATEASLEKLGLEYVDLYLIHWPRPDADKYVETWQLFEQLKAEGKTRSIGVSNFHVPHLERLANETDTVPAANQIELHPAFAQKALRAYDQEHGIATESWGPLGQNKYPLLETPAIVSIASAHGATAAQVVIAWHLAHGLVVIPKTTHHDRMRENFAAAELTLTAADVAAIDALDEGRRVGADPDTATF